MPKNVFANPGSMTNICSIKSVSNEFVLIFSYPGQCFVPF